MTALVFGQECRWATLQHGRMRPHRAGKTQAPGNAAIGAGGFGFGGPVDVDAHGGLKNLASTEG
jgi:hypothetical protein